MNELTQASVTVDARLQLIRAALLDNAVRGLTIEQVHDAARLPVVLPANYRSARKLVDYLRSCGQCLTMGRGRGKRYYATNETGRAHYIAKWGELPH